MQVATTGHTTIYELPRATPLVTGPGGATVLWLWPQRLVAALDAPGTYRVRIRWSPYWHVSAGCAGRAADGLTELHVPSAGLVELRFGVSVTRSLQTLAGTIPTCSKTDAR